MATIKSYTNLSQSETLSKILPLESADMWYDNDGESIASRPEVRYGSFVGLASKNIPCWSLAALLSVLQYPTLFQNGDKEWGCTAWIDTTRPYSISPKDNPIDACYELILKLHELKML